MRERLQDLVAGYPPNSYNTAINRAYNDLGRQYPWVNMHGEATLVTKAFIETGAVDFTNGAALITAAASVSAGWTLGESNGFAGMFIKKSDESAYFVITSSDSVSVTITENYPGATVAGSGYTIFQHIYPVTAFETITHVIHENYLDPIDTILVERLDSDFDAEGEPVRWRNAGITPTGVARCQLYPAKIDDIYDIRVRGRIAPATLTESDTALLDSNLLVAYARVELLDRKMLTAPATVTPQQMQAAVENAALQLNIAIDNDWRRRTVSNETPDNFFRGYHRGQQWYVEHDPREAYY
jgi:hypothetical protein